MKYSSIMQDPATTVSRIVKNVYLGGWYAAHDKQFLLDKNITLIVNCTNHIQNLNMPGLTHYRIPVEDAEIIDLEQPESITWNTYIPKAMEIMTEHLGKGGAILVHCHRGVQRSASVVVAFLCKLQGYKKKDVPVVAKFVLSKRPCVFNYGANFNFYLSVVYYTTII